MNLIFLMLAMHENVQQRIFEEINEVFGDDQELVFDADKLSQLKYVEQSIKETLRLLSPAIGNFSKPGLKSS